MICSFLALPVYGQEVPKVIRVALDEDFAPYSFRDSTGELQGIVKDTWELWEARTGIKVTLKATNWAKAQKAMQSGEADVIDTISRDPGREQVYDFSEPYANSEVRLFFDKCITGIVDARSSKGFSVGVKEGDLSVTRLREAGGPDGPELRRYPSAQSIIDGVARREIRVFCMSEQPAHYFLHQRGLSGEFGETEPLYTSRFSWAVHKHDSKTFKLVAAGFAKITEAERKKIQEKWQGPSLRSSSPSPFDRIGERGGIAVIGICLGLAVGAWRWRATTGQAPEMMASKLRALNLAHETTTKAYHKSQATLEAIPDLLFEIDDQGNFLQAPTGRDHLLAEPRDVLLRRTVKEVMPAMAAATILKAIGSARGAGQDFGRVFRQLLNNREHWFEISVGRMAGTDSAPSYILISRDITERRETELKLRAERDLLAETVAARAVQVASLEQDLDLTQRRLSWVLDASRDGIWDWDIKSGKSYCSQAFFTMLGYHPDNLPPNQDDHWIAHLDEGDKEAVLVETTRRLASPGHYELEFCLRTRDGAYKWILSRGKVVERDEDGRPARAIGIHIDLSDRKNYERDLEEARASADAAAHSRSDFLEDMSREMRAPMNTVVGLSELALRTALPPRLQGYLTKIQGAGQHVLGVVNDITTYSQIESGKLILERRDFLLQRLLVESTTFLQHKISNPDLKLIIDVDSDVPGNLLGDLPRLRQILVKLGLHALKLTQSGEIVFSVRLAESNEHDLLIYFAVRDTGSGLTDKQKKLLFFNFPKIGPTNRNQRRSGMALAICKQLAEQMGGEIGVESAPDEGCTVWFTARLGRGSHPSATTHPEENPQVEPQRGPGLAIDSSRIPAGVDAGQVVAVCQRLDLLLSNNDCETVDLVEENSELLKRIFPETFEAIDDAIQDFEFQDALTLLRSACGVDVPVK